MNIEWTLTKARGNYRPVLTYTITLTEFEKNLAVPAVRITSTIPKPPEAGWTHCWPHQNERADWEPSEFYQLMTPSHKTKDTRVTIKLPWRESNAYPEVEASLAALRDAFEQMLVNSMNSAALKQSGNMETSVTAKRNIAPAFAADRILKSIARKTA